MMPYKGSVYCVKYPSLFSPSLHEFIKHAPGVYFQWTCLGKRGCSFLFLWKIYYNTIQYKKKNSVAHYTNISAWMSWFAKVSMTCATSVLVSFFWPNGLCTSSSVIACRLLKVLHTSPCRITSLNRAPNALTSFAFSFWAQKLSGCILSPSVTSPLRVAGVEWTMQQRWSVQSLEQNGCSEEDAEHCRDSLAAGSRVSTPQN